MTDAMLHLAATEKAVQHALLRPVQAPEHIVVVAPGTRPSDPPEAVWRIWSTRHQMWFLPGAVDYTRDITQSGRFMPREALAIYEHAARGWSPHTSDWLPTVMLVPT